MIVYSIDGNRFCFNIQRQHKSNGVYYVVDLEKGEFYQKCFDPDCRRFKSVSFSIPFTVSLSFHMENPMNDSTNSLNLQDSQNPQNSQELINSNTKSIKDWEMEFQNQRDQDQELLNYLLEYENQMG